MRRSEKNINQKRSVIWKVLAVVMLLIVAVAVFYLMDYYHADMDAIEAFTAGSELTYKTLDNGNIVYEPQGATTGFIFYPGGKVEYTAYIPLMQACAEQGILCVLVEMPMNLAVLDVNAADGIQKQYPQIRHWYIGGHSLGGAMAASYLSDHKKSYEGLILLGAYSSTDLSDTELQVLSVYGSQDKVLDHEKYGKYKSNLPEDFTEVILQGGCHAYFGMYGKQDGDGTPTITNEEQIRLTAAEIIKIMQK